MKLLPSEGGCIVVSDLVGILKNEKLHFASETIAEIATVYRRRLTTPYRIACINSRPGSDLLWLSAEECLQAIDSELARTSAIVQTEGLEQWLRTMIKNVIWKVANLKEGQHFFDMLKYTPDEALHLILSQFKEQYRSTRKYIIERYNYDLREMEYAQAIWMHLNADGTWRTIANYKGEGTVYGWLKTVCRNCITAYVESIGYRPIQRKNIEENDEEREMLEMGSAHTDHIFVRLDDTAFLTQIADNTANAENDFNTIEFLTERIAEMPWDDWEKAFAMDSIINNLPIVDLTDKYGGLAAQLNGKSEAYNRSWTDNRNSRMKHDLYRYAQAYFDADYATLATYAERHRQRAERLRHKRLAV